MNTVTFMVGIGIFFYLLTMWAIIDIAQKDFGSFEKKALWVLVASIPFIGFIIYFLIGRKKVKKSDKK